MANFIGKRVEIHTFDSVYGGVFRALNEKTGRITLNEVVNMKTKKHLLGVMYFFPDELKEMRIVKVEKESKVVKTDGSEQGGKLLKPAHPKQVQNLNRIKYFPPEDAKTPEPEIVKPDTYHGEMSCKLPNLDSMKYTVLYDTGLDFKNAVDMILKCKLIGIAAEGSRLGRDGKLLWIQIGLPNQCFLFDIHTIGAGAAFSGGLQDVLEAPNVQKVIHNCRQLSDYLHHQHQIKFVNVFDTQVADVLVYQNQNRGDLPRFVRPVSQLVPMYIDMDVADIHEARARLTLQEQDEMKFWGTRPHSEQIIQTAMFNVQYLLTLYLKLQDKLYEPLRTGVDIFLGSLRDCPAQQYQTIKNNSNLLPNEFVDLSQYQREGSYFVDNDKKMSDHQIELNSIQHQAEPNYEKGLEEKLCRQAKTANTTIPQPHSQSVDARNSPPSTSPPDSLSVLGAESLSKHCSTPSKQVRRCNKQVQQASVTTSRCNKQVCKQVCRSFKQDKTHVTNSKTDEDFGDIPDHKKCFPNEMMNNRPDWGCLSGVPNTEQEDHDSERAKARANNTETQTNNGTAKGYGADNANTAIDQNERHPLHTSMPKVLGRGQVLAASVLSPPKVGNKPNRNGKAKIPLGRAAFLSAFRKG